MPTASRARALPWLVPLVIVLAGCAGGSGAQPSSTASEPVTSSPVAAPEPRGVCDLVPIEEVEAALGMSTDGGVGDTSILSGGETCRFTGDDEHIVDVEMSEQSRDEWFEAIETVGLTDEVVEDVGEEAYRAAETALGGPGARFTAWADGREVGVTIYSDEPQDVTFTAAQAIAEAVLAAGE